MEEVKRYAVFVGNTFHDSVMDVMHLIQYGSSWPVKIYFFLIHVLLLSLVLYMFLYFKKAIHSKNVRKGTRTFKRGNRVVTSESCQWLNSVIAWYYRHYSTKNTFDLVKLWIRNMNRTLYKKRTNNQRIFITNIRPYCLPPKLTSVYCLSVDGIMKCITFHVESNDLGFHVHVSQPSLSNGRSKNVILEVNVVKMSGEVVLQLNDTPFEVKMSFIGEPEIQFSSRAITKTLFGSKPGIGNEVVEKTEETKLQCSVKTTVEDTNGDGIDGETVDAVEAKLKEVICKTVTNVPLADDDEMNSGSLKDKLDSPILQTCVGEEGKLLVKAKMSPYCILTSETPYQRKRTSLMKETDCPFWNEFFAFDITSKTREITLNIFDFEKTPSDANYHMDDNELSEEKDDFLGQAIVPLATVNRNQTCRLILPILPKTNKCDYVKGELSLEFTFDKDGKVIDGALPLVDINDSSAKPTAVEQTVYDVTIDKSQVVPCVNKDLPESKRYSGAYAYSLDKSYMETSLDELAQEIEAYEAETTSSRSNQEKSAEVLLPVKTKGKDRNDREHDDTELLLEVAALDATLGETSSRKRSPVVTPPESSDKLEEIDESPRPDEEEVQEESKQTEEPTEEETREEKEEPDAKEEPKEETITEPKQKSKKSLFRRRPKSTVDGDKKEIESNRHSYHAGDLPSQETAENEEGNELNREPKSKMRRSFNMKFKRGKKDKEASSTQEVDASKDEPQDENKEQEAMEESLKSDPPKSRFKSRFKKDKEKDTIKEDTKEEAKDEKNEEEKTEEKPEATKSRFMSRFKKEKDAPSTPEEGETSKEKTKEEAKDEKNEEEKTEEKPEATKSRFMSRFKKEKDAPSTPEEGETSKDKTKEEQNNQEPAEDVKADVPKSRFKSRFKRDKNKDNVVPPVDVEVSKEEGKEEEKKEEQNEQEKKEKETSTPEEEPPKEEEKKSEEVTEESGKQDPPKSRFMSRFKKDKDAVAQDGDVKKDEPDKEIDSGHKSRFSGRFKRSKDKKQKKDEEEKEVETKKEEETEEVPVPIVVDLTSEEPNREEVKEEEPVKEEAKAEETKEEEQKEEPTQEEAEKKEEPKQEEEPKKEEEPKQEEPKEDEEKENKPVKNELETVDENNEETLPDKPADQPKSRFRRLNFKRPSKRPVSMSAADLKPAESTDDKDPVTHSYHAGDLPETSKLRKSNSQTSLLSYSPNPFSSLVIEVKDRGEKKYYRIPPAMVKRGTYEQKGGEKYHVYNDHMFKAVHFDAATDCSVCSKPISGKLGKQGYQCKGCKMTVHKKCHFQTSDMCSEKAAQKVTIEDREDHLI